MTYYEKLVRRATVAMKRHPMSTVVLDADSMEVLAKSTDPAKAARGACGAIARGRTPVIVERPRDGETWIL